MTAWRGWAEHGSPVDRLVAAYAQGTDPMTSGTYRTQEDLRAEARDLLRALQAQAWAEGMREHAAYASGSRRKMPFPVNPYRT